MTQEHQIITGLFTAIITPFRNDQIDEEGLRKNINHQIDGGVNGIVALGTTGETPTLTRKEQDQVITAVISECRGQIPVVVGTGTNSTASTIENTRRAKELGADMALVVTPYYNKPSQEGIVAHFTKVAEEGGLPVIVYNIPGRSAVNISTATMERIARINGIAGVKEASGDVNQAADVIVRIQNHCPGFSVLAGDDSLALPLMAIGGRGVISVTSNVAPALFSRLINSALEGNFAKATQYYHEMLPLYRALFLETNPAPVKAAMELCGLAAGGLRLPLVAASESTVEVLQSVLKELKLLTKG